MVIPIRVLVMATFGPFLSSMPPKPAREKCASYRGLCASRGLMARKPPTCSSGWRLKSRRVAIAVSLTSASSRANSDLYQLVVDALMDKSGALGLNAFLPAPDRRYGQRRWFKPAIPTPRLPLARNWNTTDFSLIGVLGNNTGVMVREWVEQALIRYRFVVGEHRWLPSGATCSDSCLRRDSFLFHDVAYPQRRQERDGHRR